MTEKSIKEILPARLHQLRKSAGLTLQQVAAHLQIKPKAYQHYESGVASPNLSTVFKLVELYNLSSVEELVYGINGLNPKKENPIIEKYRRLSVDHRKVVDYLFTQC